MIESLRERLKNTPLIVEQESSGFLFMWDIAYIYDEDQLEEIDIEHLRETLGDTILERRELNSLLSDLSWFIRKQFLPDRIVEEGPSDISEGVYRIRI
tara:strand:+ start:461 stop:754 length:294 start_codon:yes stop_codon:yes gene_type:complete